MKLSRAQPWIMAAMAAEVAGAAFQVWSQVHQRLAVNVTVIALAAAVALLAVLNMMLSRQLWGRYGSLEQASAALDDRTRALQEYQAVLTEMTQELEQQMRGMR